MPIQSCPQSPRSSWSALRTRGSGCSPISYPEPAILLVCAKERETLGKRIFLSDFRLPVLVLRMTLVWRRYDNKNLSNKSISFGSFPVCSLFRWNQSMGSKMPLPQSLSFLGTDQDERGLLGRDWFPTWLSSMKLQFRHFWHATVSSLTLSRHLLGCWSDSTRLYSWIQPLECCEIFIRMAQRRPGLLWNPFSKNQSHHKLSKCVNSQTRFWESQ